MKKNSLLNKFTLRLSAEGFFHVELTSLNTSNKITENPCVPYSGFKLDAAVLMANGEIINNSKYVTTTYPLCISIEKTRLTAPVNRFTNFSVLTVAFRLKKSPALHHLYRPIFWTHGIMICGCFGGI